MELLQKGFTLIEIMIALAIIGILAAIAVPQYSHYLTRARITEGIQIAASAKIAVAEYQQANNNFPSSNLMAGLSENINSKYVDSVMIGNEGVITITYKEAAGAGTSSTLTLSPTMQDGVISWACGGSMDNQYKPANCREEGGK